MTAFLVRRLAAAVLFVLAVAIAAVILTRLAPGDPLADLRLAGASEATIEAERDRLGLDRPLFSHLLSWLGGVARFDLGRTRAGQPVAWLVADAAQHTAFLASIALLLATAIGLPLGIATGARPHGWLAKITLPISTVLLACPPMIGALALLLVAVETEWLAAQGNVTLPAIALALPLAAWLERLQSQATREAMTSPDLVAAAARGIPPRRLVWVHAARQSLRPVLGVFGVVIGSLFSGSLAVEAIAGWPGLGRLMLTALTGREIFLVAGVALAGAVMIALGNMAADLLRAWADPRVRST